MQKTNRFEQILGGLEIGFGILLFIWIPFVVMLYGGILQAVENWGVNNSAVVWGIIRAVCCEIGIIPGWVLIFIGTKTLEF